LIVTGREPRAQILEDEPYWASFKSILDWARDNTYSTVWSCLAAHAAILYLDGIARIRSDRKYTGIFDFEKRSDHPLIAGTPSRFKLPHSRWNGIQEDTLTKCGYSVLTRAEDAGVDTFIKHFKSLFVFFQGHPEYDSNALLLEYRRDVARFLKEEINAYPAIPQDYFDDDTTLALQRIQQLASTRPSLGLLTEVAAILDPKDIKNTWHSTAVRIYKNWLQYIWAQKTQQPQITQVGLVPQRVDASLPYCVAAAKVPA
ncbi:MAG: homoserine O-succinyltransferase, partial [Puia sp.]|nr:homoserine O-succinyltransferase [Puia sp.]